jgi:phage/plasmid-associated DNA primase
MPADYPNRVYGLVSPKLPSRFNETLIEPFEGVDMEDRCLRILGALINVTKCFKTNVNWDHRAEWLLPPNYRWYGTGQVRVNLTNLQEKPTCPTFQSLINGMFDGDEIKKSCLQMAFGKILLCPMFLDYNQFLAFFGTPGSGKSTTTNLLTHLIGEHDVAVLRGNFGGRFDTSELPGKRLVLFPENEDGTNHHFTPEMAATIKKVTGRDLLTCERKGQQPITTRIDAEILIVGNAPPTIEMDEEAFRRRAVFLKAVNKIAEPDYGRSRELMMGPELPGIFLWALEGACRIARGEKLITPPDCMEDLQHATIHMNQEQRFVQQMVVEKVGKRLYMTDLEEGFRQWLRHNRLANREPGWGKLSGAIREKFGDKYKAVPGKDEQRNSTRVYQGLALAELLY